MLLRLFTWGTMLYLRLLGARRSRVQRGEVSLVYYRLGPKDGEPWVLLHGLGANAISWFAVAQALRRDCRLILPELSALGGTRTPTGGLGIEAGAEIAAWLIERELGQRPVTVAGLSLGGWMAVRLALSRPELVGRLVLVNAGGFRDQDWETIRSLVDIDDLPGVDRLYDAIFARVPWLMRRTRPGFLAAYTSAAVKSVLAEISEPDTFTQDDLGRIQAPTALIWGEHDGLFKVEIARAMAAVLPDAHLQVLPGCSHAVHVERPRLLVEAIQRFRRATLKPQPEPAGGRSWPARST
jgi:pimeloyl-ACP methyl ester carboxylesterase